MPDVSNQRAYELDILRGLAALFVVIHHWRFLFFPVTFVAPHYDALPLHALFLPIYTFGELFVDVFFSISGYVFFWLYADAIADRQIDSKRFFHLRFARIYPLFFVTLIAVAVLQGAYKALNGQYLIYVDNSLLDFVRNLFLIQGWTTHGAQSFNGPAWSISVEILLYILFFIFCRLRLNRLVWLLAAVIAGVWAKEYYGFVATGLPSFFLGGLSVYIVQRIAPQTSQIKWPLLIVTVALWLATYIRANAGLFVFLPVDTLLPSGFFKMNTFWAMLTPLTLITLAIWFRGKQAMLKPFAWLGDISYSVYLLHFPLILLISLWLSQQTPALREAIAHSPWAMAGFIVLLLGISKLSHDYFEVPMRNGIRQFSLAMIVQRRVIKTE